MEKYGNFPKDILREGCALRYEYLFKEKMIKRKLNKMILAALPIDIKNSLNLLNFLLKTFGKDQQISIKIKFHPLASPKKILSKLKNNLPNHFEIVGDKDIKELIRNIDAIVYTDTTVCMEALMMGIPAIFANIDNFYNMDRLFDCNFLKWSVKSKEELYKVIDDIYQMDDVEFQKQQKLARNYIKNYFSQVSQKRLNEFL